MPKSKTEAEETVEKVSSRKRSDDKKIEGHTASGRGTAKTRKPVKNPKRKGGAPTTSALDPVGEISDLLVSEFAKLGSPDNHITPQQLSFPV